MTEEGILKQTPTRNMFQNGNPSPAEDLGIDSSMVDGDEILLAKNSIIRLVENQTYKKMSSNILGKPVKPPKPNKLLYSKKFIKKTEESISTDSVKNDYFFRANRTNIADNNSSNQNQPSNNVNIENSSKIEFIVKKDYISTVDTNSNDRSGYSRAETVHIENNTPDSEDSYGGDSGINNLTKNPNANSIFSLNNNSSGTVASGQSTTDYFSNETQREDTFFTYDANNVLNSESVFSSRSSTRDSRDHFKGSIENDFSIKPALPIPLPSALNVVGVYDDGSYALENGHYFYQVPGIPQVLDEADEDDENMENSDQNNKPSKNVHFSLSPITIFSTYSKTDYDRRNNEIDPVTATMEWEYEKKLEKMDLIKIELNKTRQGFGFNIAGVPLTDNEDEERIGIYIKAITPGGIAERDGRLCVNDQIIEVNGENLLGQSYQASSKILRNTQGIVKFLIGRERSNVNENDKQLGNQNCERDDQQTDDGINNGNTEEEEKKSQIIDEAHLNCQQERRLDTTSETGERQINEDSVERLRKILAEASATAAKAHANRLAEDEEDEDDNYKDNQLAAGTSDANRISGKSNHQPFEDNRNIFRNNRESTTLDPDVISKEMENLNELERQLDRQLELSFGKNLPKNISDQMIQSSEGGEDVENGCCAGDDEDNGDDEELDEDLDAYLENPKECALTSSNILNSSIAYIASLTCPPTNRDQHELTDDLQVPRNILEMALMEGRLVLSKSFVQQLRRTFENEPSLKDEANVVAALFFLSTAIYQKHLTIISKHRRIRNLGEKLSSHEAAADEAIERLCLRCHSLEMRLKNMMSSLETTKLSSVEMETNTDDSGFISPHEYQEHLLRMTTLRQKFDELQTAYHSSLSREKDLELRLADFMDTANGQKLFYEKVVADANEKIKNLETKLAENFTNTQNGMSKLTA